MTGQIDGLGAWHMDTKDGCFRIARTPRLVWLTLLNKADGDSVSVPMSPVDMLALADALIVAAKGAAPAEEMPRVP